MYFNVVCLVSKELKQITIDAMVVLIETQQSLMGCRFMWHDSDGGDQLTNRNGGIGPWSMTLNSGLAAEFWVRTQTRARWAGFRDEGVEPWKTKTTNKAWWSKKMQNINWSMTSVWNKKTKTVSILSQSWVDLFLANFFWLQHLTQSAAFGFRSCRAPNGEINGVHFFEKLAPPNNWGSFVVKYDGINIWFWWEFPQFKWFWWKPINLKSKQLVGFWCHCSKTVSFLAMSDRQSFKRQTQVGPFLESFTC